MVRIGSHRQGAREPSLLSDECVPNGILVILEEEVLRAGGDHNRALEVLRERLVDDSTLTIERSRLVRWLMTQERPGHRLHSEWN